MGQYLLSQQSIADKLTCQVYQLVRGSVALS